MKILWMIILLMGMVSCIDTGAPSYLASITDSEGDSDSRIGRRRSVRSTNQCEESERCENICDQILDYSSERRDCYRLSLKEIGKIEEVFDELKDINNLADIRGGDFDLFASIALSSWSNLIRGEYRRDEEEDDDDEDMDDEGRPAYNSNEAQEVLSWIIVNKSIAESIRDFSSKDNHIIADLLVRRDGSLSCSGNDDDGNICRDLNSSSLTNGEKSILENIKAYLSAIVRSSPSDDEVSAIYELTHDVLSRVCENVDSIRSYGSERSYKACLSWVYFCPSVYDEYSSNQIDQYLLKDTYRNAVEGSLRDCTFLTNEPEWSDYWD